MSKSFDQAGPAGATQGAVGTPDVKPAMDTHFLLLEVGKLISSVDRLKEDVKDHGTKLNTLLARSHYTKGWIAGAAAVVTAAIAIVGYVISGKFNAVMAVLQALPKH